MCKQLQGDCLHGTWLCIAELYLDIRGKGLLANYFNDFLKGNNLHRFANNLLMVKQLPCS